MGFQIHKFYICKFCVDISFVESPPSLQSSQNMLKTHFQENNFPPNLSRFEFKFTADINRKYLEKIENIHIQCLYHDFLRWQIIKGAIFPLLIMVRWVTSNMSYYWEPAGHGGPHIPGFSLVSRSQSCPLIGQLWEWPQGAHYTA